MELDEVRGMKRKVVFSISIILLFFIVINAFSFTITTAIKEPGKEIKSLAELEEAPLRIDVTGLREWHSQYFFVPIYYGPRLVAEEGKLVYGYDEPRARFRVLLGTTILNCSDGVFRVSESHKAGETQRCDIRGRDGIAEYRIDRVEGPDFGFSSKKGWKVFSIPYYKMSGEDPTVSIDFSVRFRLDEGTGSGGEFTQWASTEEELKALLESASISMGGEVPTVEETKEICTPVIQTISYKQQEFSEPSSFYYESYGDAFSVLLGASELCSVSDLMLGFWNSSGLTGEPVSVVEFYAEEIWELDVDGKVSKSIVISEADYPEKLYFGAKLVNAEGKEFYSEPIEFYFPSAEKPPEPEEPGIEAVGGGLGEQTEEALEEPVEPPVIEELGGCVPCKSIVGCLACIDRLLVMHAID